MGVHINWQGLKFHGCRLQYCSYSSNREKGSIVLVNVGHKCVCSSSTNKRPPREMADREALVDLAGAETSSLLRGATAARAD
jgi:hypothetical protein